MDFFDYDSGFDVEKFLERSREGQRQRLEEELERIDEQLENRDELHEDVLDELGSERDWYIERLETLYKRGTGKTGEREDLKRRIEEFYQEVRQERRQAWRDKQQLEQERRELLRELSELDDADTVLDLL